MKEYHVSYQEKVFPENDPQEDSNLTLMFRMINRNGNIIMLKEMFKLYKKQYMSLLNKSISTRTTEIKDNWITINAILGHNQCLEFNMMVLKKIKGVDWIKDNEHLCKLCGFAIE